MSPSREKPFSKVAFKFNLKRYSAVLEAAEAKAKRDGGGGEDEDEDEDKVGTVDGVELEAAAGEEGETEEEADGMGPLLHVMEGVEACGWPAHFNEVGAVHVSECS